MISSENCRIKDDIKAIFKCIWCGYNGNSFSILKTTD